MNRSHADDKIFNISDQTDIRIAANQIKSLYVLRNALDVDISILVTIVTELGSNIVKYAEKGFIRLNFIGEEQNDTVIVDVWAEDEGPGISNVDMAMQDNYSTGSTLGLGLPGVKRMADFFWIGSGKGNGTVVHVRKVIKRVIRHHNSQREIQYLPPGRDSKFDLGTCVRPIEGAVTSGDGAFAVTLDKGIILAIVDVTGHGSAAHELVRKIANVIQTYANEDLIYLLNKIHESLFGTLGAAIGLIYVNTDKRNFSYVGIGNTSASRCVGNPWRGVSRDGICGHRMPSLYVLKEDLQDGDILFMFTDGVSHSDSQKYIKLNSHLPAEVLARDVISLSGKPHDDSGCIVFRYKE